jgi:EmrB/QacA subfamily drug resistance transporter
VVELSLERRQTLTLAATVLGSSLAFIDATVVIVALPTIQRDLHMSLAGQQWVFLAYSLSLAALYLVGGAVGDRYGRRNTFIAGVAGFALTSVIAGAAPNEAVLIVARGLQGIAGAFLTTNSLALIRAVYAENAGRAIGLWTAFTSVATLAGPPAGGALVEWVSWRWIFFINLPLAGLAVLLAQVGRCDERAELRLGRLDLPGAALTALGFGTLTYGLVEGAHSGFKERWWAFVISAVALGLFAYHERRTANPMLPFELFRRRNFAVVNLETFVLYAALYGSLVYFTLYLQFLGFSPFAAGLLQIPTSLVMILFAARFGGLADRHGPRLYLTLGPVLLGLGSLALLGISDRTDFWTFGVVGIALTSFGLAIFVAPITATALKAAPPQFAGIASGVNSTVSRLGSLLAVALVGLVISLVFHNRVDAENAVPLAKNQQGAELRDASRAGFRAGMLLVAGLAFTSAAIAGLGISDREARGEVQEPVSEQAAAPAES